MRTLTLDIVDYPGEWLLDLPLLDKSYEQWSAESLAQLRGTAAAPALAAGWLAHARDDRSARAGRRKRWRSKRRGCSPPICRPAATSATP